MAWSLGLDHGTDIVFTYGPLGFLLVPEPFVGLSSVAGIGVVGLLHLAMSITLLALARRAFPFWAAFLVAYVSLRALQSLDAPERILALVFLASVELVRLKREPWIDSVAVAVGAFLSAFALLSKVSIGLALLTVTGLTTLAVIRPVWRGPVILVGSLTTSLAVLWLVAGQSVDAAWPFATGAYNLVVGYSAAMGVDTDPTVHWQVLAFLVCATVVATGAWQAARGLDAVRRAGIIGICFLFLFATWKIGFVRWHSAWAILLAGTAWFAFLDRTWNRSHLLLGLSVILVSFLGVTQVQPTTLLDPSKSVADFARDVGLTVSGDLRRSDIANTREELRKIYALDAPTEQLIQRGTVHVDPVEAGVIFAYQLSWRPTPIFQSYSAYTLELDHRNADLLRSISAPQHILRYEPFGIDGRNPWFDAPDAVLEMLCRYNHIHGTAGWEVLARGPSRCGEADLIVETSATTGEAVAVPVDGRPDRLTYVSIDGVDTSLLDKLKSTFYQSDDWHITLNGTRWRLVPAQRAGP